MTQESQLALTDPVPEETLQVLGEIQIGLQGVAAEFLALEERKIHLLLLSKQLKSRSRQIFTALCLERGLAPDTIVEVDEHTKQLRLVES